VERIQVKPALLLGISIGILGALISLLPVSAAWEEEIGLGLLFKLRGQRPPPREVEIISINGETATQLGLGEEIPEWPRSLHAKLLERLKSAAPALIVFDIFFKKPRDLEADTVLSNAIRHSGNVVLVSYLQQQQVRTGKEIHHIERLLHPTEILADAALDLAPFVLPKVPVRVSRFWTFSGNQQILSLPTAALLHLTDPDGGKLQTLLEAAGEQPESAGPSTSPVDYHAITQRLRNDRALLSRLRLTLEAHRKQLLTADQHQHLLSLLSLYEGNAYPYLNFYGPPGSVTTHPIQNILDSPAQALERFRGKTVFIGYAGAYQPKQKDGFYTIFSQPNGLDISGVEIAATAFANLLKRETLSPLTNGWLTLLLISFGMIITLLFRLLPGIPGISAGLGFGAGYFCSVYLLFSQLNLWLPWFIPLMLQAPLALILSLTWHYQEMRNSREQLRRLFGYYLPGDVIDRLANDNKRPVGQIESAYGVCLASDAQNYTAMAEKMEPEALQRYLNRYFELLFTPIRANDGVVSDVIGDAMLAIWPSTHIDHNLQQLACEAALEIGKAIETSDLEPKLFTRIGLHSGELVMSHVGAIDHFEYRAVGDMVNTTSRIENLNKLLGTRVLASEDFVKDLRDIVTRELGKFRVAGKQQPVNLYEVAARSESATEELLRLHRLFAEALQEWRQGDRASAYGKFEEIAKDYPDDGPTQYYLQQFHERRSSRKSSF
jgi:adenylate cyclase